jgi:tetratricopeptide (TPR) repeat protein
VLLNLDNDRVRKLSTCRLDATDLLAGYNQLHDRLLRDQSPQESGRLLGTTLVDLQKKDINYLDGDCPQLLAEAGSSATGGMAADMASLESKMAALLAAGDFQGVIAEYQSLALPPGMQPSFGVTYTYGLALLKNGRKQDARMVFADLLSRVRGQGAAREEAKLLSLLGDMDFGQGEYSSARGYYKELEKLYTQLGEDGSQVRRKLAMLDSADMHSLEVRSFGELLLAARAYNPARDGYTLAQKCDAFLRQFPMSMVAGDVQAISTRATDEAEKWFGELLAHVDKLTDQGQPGKALELLQQVPRDILPLDKQAILKLKIDTLAVAVPSVLPATSGIVEEEIIQTDFPAPGPESTTPVGESSVDGTAPVEGAGPGEVHVSVPELQKTWDQGMADMQAKNYDAAIAVFSGLLNTSMGDQAREQVAEASRLAAQENRKKAAELFVRAAHATSSKARRDLLLSSRLLLEDILRKYPHSGLDDKVRRNLNRINQELATLNTDISAGPTD